MKRPLLLTAALLLAVGTAHAAEGGAHHAPSWSLTLWAMVNFVIYIFVLRRFAWPLVVEYLQDRRDRVVSALEAAARARREAEALKAEFETRMKSLEHEAARAREELLSLAKVEAGKLLAQAEQTAEKIRRDAEIVADQEVARARRALQAESAEIIARVAAEILSREVTPEDQERFVRDFLAETRDAAR
jgi:F-type H+-transporting ATPase subunit b